MQLARTPPVTVELAGGKGYSENDLTRAMNTAHDSVAQHTGISEVHSDYDAGAGVITIQARPAQSTMSRASADRLRALVQPAQPANSKIRVEVRIGDLPAAGRRTKICAAVVG